MLSLAALISLGCAEEPPANYAVDYVERCRVGCSDVCAQADTARCQTGCEETYGWSAAASTPACGQQWDPVEASCDAARTCTSDGMLYIDPDAACDAQMTAWSECIR